MRDRDYYPAGAYDDEEWRPCQNFEKKYLISNYGRIISTGTYNTCKTGKMIKQFKKNGRNGYMQVLLYDNNRRSSVEVHRLVAIAFVANPKNLPCVNHIDEDKTNNYYKNLEWCTNRYNIRYSNAKGVDVYTKDGVFISSYEAITDASKAYSIPSANISRCCKSKCGTAQGFQFRYKGEPFTPKPFTNYQYRKSRRGHNCNESRFVPINVYTKTGEFVGTYRNLSEAASIYNTTTGNICKCYRGEILTNKGYIFLRDTNIEERLQQISKQKSKRV